MAVSGFSEEAVSRSIQKLQDEYNNLYYYLCDQTQSKFIDFIATGWACTDAQEFFRSASTEINQTLRNITAKYGETIETINSAAKRWADQMGSSYIPKSFTAQNGSVNSDSVRENINGERGADDSILDEANTNIAQIKDNASRALDESVRAVADSGFKDDEQAQQQSLEQSLINIKNGMNQMLDRIQQEATAKIKATKEAYGAVIRANVNTFSSMGQG